MGLIKMESMIVMRFLAPAIREKAKAVFWISKFFGLPVALAGLFRVVGEIWKVFSRQIVPVGWMQEKLEKRATF